MQTVDLTFHSYVNDALEKALPEELVKSLKEEESLKAGSIWLEVDVEELDLKDIDYERLKLKKISFVLEEQNTERRWRQIPSSDIPNLSLNDRNQNCKLRWKNWWNVTSSCGSGFLYMIVIKQHPLFFLRF
nr:hypothetical protein CFP56_16108 [Quercus suber]